MAADDLPRRHSCTGSGAPRIGANLTFTLSNGMALSPHLTCHVVKIEERLSDSRRRSVRRGIGGWGEGWVLGRRIALNAGKPAPGRCRHAKALRMKGGSTSALRWASAV